MTLLSAYFAIGALIQFYLLLRTPKTAKAIQDREDVLNHMGETPFIALLALIITAFLWPIWLFSTEKK